MDIEGLFPGTVAVDVNAIPPEAIDHIEILRDGAGAMYGSDAIAGVVNIVLKSGANGGDVDALYGANRTNFAPTGETITDGRSKTIERDYGMPIGAGWIHFGADYRDTGATNRAGPTSSSASYNSTPADVALNNHIVFQSGDPATINKSLFYNASLPTAGGYETVFVRHRQLPRHLGRGVFPLSGRSDQCAEHLSERISARIDGRQPGREPGRRREGRLRRLEMGLERARGLQHLQLRPGEFPERVARAGQSDQLSCGRISPTRSAR